MASVEKTKTSNGEVRYRVRYRDPDGRSREEWYRRRIDADRRARNVEVEKDFGEWIDRREGTLLFGEFLNRWAMGRVHLRPTTLSTQRSLIKNHIVPRLGRRQIGQIRHSDIQRMIAEMEEAGRSPSTIRAVHALVSQALEAAANDRVIPRNPALHVNLPSLQKTEMRILDHEEIRLLTEAVEDRYRPTVLLGAYCGLRLGEIGGLRVESLNLVTRSVTVSASLNEVDGNVILGPPKTTRSRRTIALPAFVAGELSRHLDRFPPTATGFVVTGPDGGGLRRSNFRKRVWTPAVTSSIGEPCTFHDLRHSHAALLIREGLHPKVIQERMGHASIRTTLDTYGHLLPGLDDRAAVALDASVRGVGVGLDRPEAAAT